jgi:3-methyladenine DNA glycosylase AlkD
MIARINSSEKSTSIVNVLNKLRNPRKATVLQRFFKTGKGEYGEGDVFLGITVPILRDTAKRFDDLMFPELETLLNSKIHEHRLTALFVLIKQYTKAKKSEKARREIYDFYVANMQHINNWDLVDLSAPKIIGDFLFNKNKDSLYKWARDKNLWKRRIAIISTQYFIRQNHFDDTLSIAAILLKDREDLIHKGVGWMLREVGKRDITLLENFLDANYKFMPRTMLRYAIEKFSPEKRMFYLQK